MDVDNNWNEVRRLFSRSFRSSFHYAVATTAGNGEPHVTPIGSLILTRQGQGFYFEKYATQLSKNIQHNNRVCVLAVDSSKWFWLKSLVRGRFGALPAVRLYGVAKAPRPASEREKALWQKRVNSARFTRGHKLMWSDMDMVRDIEFDRIEPVCLGKMTRALWQGLS